VIQQGGLAANAGTYGTLEAYCQRDSIVQRAQFKVQRTKSKIWDLVEGNLSRITPQIVAEAASQGDPVGFEVYQEIGSFMGVGVGSFINVFAPEVVAIGGQIAKTGDVLMDSIRASARNVAIPSLMQDCKIVAAELLDDAGIKGAAALAFQTFAPSAS
jgi:glucokinase